MLRSFQGTAFELWLLQGLTAFGTFQDECEALCLHSCWSL